MWERLNSGSVLGPAPACLGLIWEIAKPSQIDQRDNWAEGEEQIEGIETERYFYNNNHAGTDPGDTERKMETGQTS